MYIEEYMPTIKWVPGVKNPVADLLSRYPIEEESFDMTIFDDLTIRIQYEYTVPLKLKDIYQAQLKDPDICCLKSAAPDQIGTVFDSTGEKAGSQQALTIINQSTQKEKILVPASQVKQLIHWYHHMLVHPGADRLYNTLAQHFYWRKMRDDIKPFVRVCKECQKGKRGLRGYGKIPLKDIETQPWKDVCTDLSGPWQAKVNHKKISFHALTCIDPFTSWIEIIPIYTKEAPFIRDQFLQQWLRRYPRPSRVIFDQGTEFDNTWMYALCARWHIKPEPITVKNPRANAIVERLHKVMGDMLDANLKKDMTTMIQLQIYCQQPHMEFEVQSIEQHNTLQEEKEFYFKATY
jgi:hypothetical protein